MKVTYKICSKCGQEYNTQSITHTHSYTTEYSDNGNGTHKKYEICECGESNVLAASEGHQFVKASNASCTRTYTSKCQNCPATTTYTGEHKWKGRSYNPNNYDDMYICLEGIEEYCTVCNKINIESRVEPILHAKSNIETGETRYICSGCGCDIIYDSRKKLWYNDN